MKKRMLALLLSLISLLAFALPAQATVLSGNTSKVDYDNTDPARYWIEIDLKNQIISVYESMTGALVLQSLCTTGSDETPTGAGVYKLGDLKERFGYFVAFGQYAQYWTQVVRGVYIHSVMYDSKDLDSMSKSAYRNLGKNLSHGCVRVLPHIAQWIYYNCPPGTTCKITNEKARNEALCKALKAAIPDYDDYEQPKDERPAPPEVPAVVRYNKTPLRTGFSATKDKTVEVMGLPADELLAGRTPDFINFDVEGAEKQAIEGCADSIRRHTPALQVALYHRSEDIFALPLMIHELNPNYRFYMRRYPYVPAWDLNLFCTEA